MQDRAPTKPNRYAVYDDGHNFIRYEYHERADEPTQAGTALNKASLLSDSVASQYGKDSNATPNDVLGVIAQKLISQPPLYCVKLLDTSGSMSYPATNTHSAIDDIGKYDIVFTSFNLTSTSGGPGFINVRCGYAGAGPINPSSASNKMTTVMYCNTKYPELKRASFGDGDGGADGTSTGSTAKVMWTSGASGNNLSYNLKIWGIKL